MSKVKNKTLLLSPQDNVIVALSALSPGETLCIDGHKVIVADSIPQGHKMARCMIGVGDPVIKYGDEIGITKTKIEAGQHVHIHNVNDNTAQVSLRERKKLGL